MVVAVAFGVLLCVACAPSPNEAAASPNTSARAETSAKPSSQNPTPAVSPSQTAKVDIRAYPWLASEEDLPALMPLAAKFSPPSGFVRVASEPDSFAQWLRGLPLRTDRTHVLSHRGNRLGSPSEAVVYLDVGKANLQQCADSAIRLHAEYLWHRNQSQKVAYHFTSGDRSAWKDWQRGERFKIAGNKVKRYRGKGRANTHQEFRNYLNHIFRYAGTQSLYRDSNVVKVGQAIEPGDFFVQPGGPGHAVVILDVAVHKDGRRVALVGQGFMPAQEFHVVKDTGSHVMDGVWFVLPQEKGETLHTPSWYPFARKMVRRFRM